MRKFQFRDIVLLVFALLGILLVVDLYEGIRIFGFYDRFHPVAVFVMWAMMLQVAMYLLGKKR